MGKNTENLGDVFGAMPEGNSLPTVEHVNDAPVLPRAAASAEAFGPQNAPNTRMRALLVALMAAGAVTTLASCAPQVDYAPQSAVSVDDGIDDTARPLMPSSATVTTEEMVVQWHDDIVHKLPNEVDVLIKREDQMVRDIETTQKNGTMRLRFDGMGVQIGDVAEVYVAGYLVGAYKVENPYGNPDDDFDFSDE